jgi:hypothetical protein
MPCLRECFYQKMTIVHGLYAANRQTSQLVHSMVGTISHPDHMIARISNMPSLVPNRPH